MSNSTRRKIAVVTTARSEFGTCRPLLELLGVDPQIELQLYVGGMHLSEELGGTVAEIEEAGFPIFERVDFLVPSDKPEGIGESVGRATTGFSKAFGRNRPDLLVLVGDRTELLAIATAALAFRIPIAHLSGGEITEGATDELVRHAMTKLSHLHFPTNEPHAARLRQLGEEDWRIHAVGDPALDRLSKPLALGRPELEEFLGIKLQRPVVVVTHHPETLGAGDGSEIDRLLEGMEKTAANYVITAPNADAGFREILDRLRDFAARFENSVFVESLGQERYYSLLAIADAMLGNSSSGIWESASFELPVVNVGDRQKGRLRANNVIDVTLDADEIDRGLAWALDPETRAGLAGMVNPYGDGKSAARIVDVLATVTIDERLLRKKFVDLV